MLWIIQQTHAAAAKAYYRSADYYAEGQELAGRWGGRGAVALGLEGEVGQAAFDSLCDNRHPADGQPLTARTKDVRRVGYDLSFHVPKSVSILYGLTGDTRILDAFREAVGETMAELERDALTRVRRGGKDETRPTGNLVWAEFVHTTARPIGGVPDPHLHAHCFVFNATFDSDERRWKAVDLGAIKRDAPYFQAAFHARLAGLLSDRGFGIDRTAAGWEVAGVPKALLPAFSRRTARIEAVAAAEGITDPKARDALGSRTREAKVSEIGVEELRARWLERLTPDDRDSIDEVLTVSFAAPLHAVDPNRAAMAYAVAHCFERSSVVPERTLLAAALKRGVGEVNVAGVAAELGGHGLIVKEHQGQRLATTREALAEERELLRFAREGRGRHRPLGGYGVPLSESLDDGQRRAAGQLLGSRDTVTLLRGAAGTGKTTLMRAAVAAIEQTGTRVVTLAPSAEAARGVLRGEGFAAADTVARFLIDETFRERARGQVIWVDEAGLLGSRTLAKLFAAAEQLDARVVLAGDRNQHGSVERGAVLRLLETQAGLVPAEITAIRRQQGDYKRAVAALAAGDVAGGFDRLDALGWVVEAPDGAREQLLAADYAAAVAGGQTALVVSPTHAEGARVTEAIRAELKERGRLGRDERRVMQLDDAGLTAAERADPVHYRAGDMVEFHQHAPGGFTRGRRYAVAAVEDKRVLVRDAGGAEQPLPLALSERFGLYRAGELALAAGDRVRVTKNATAGGRRLNNGALLTVAGFTPRGDAVLDSGQVLGAEFGHLAHGYVVTSHAAQGKTVDRVLIAQSAASLPAASREQFYVSASRARQRLTLYTDDKAELKRAIARSDPRPAAVELAGDRGPTRRAKMMAHLRRMARLTLSRAATMQQQPARAPGREWGRE